MPPTILLMGLLLPACSGPAKDAADSPPDALTVLRFSAEPGTLHEGGEVVFTAQLGHPLGPGAVSGGALSDASGALYGALPAPSAAGESALRLSWSELGAVASIHFGVGESEDRTFRAEFSDSTGATASAELVLRLDCANAAYGACDGACFALNRDDDHCGTCGNACADDARGCIDGACMTNIACTDAVSMDCAQLCAASGYFCRDTADFGVGFAYLGADCTGTEGAVVRGCDTPLVSVFPEARSGVCICGVH